MLVVGWLYLCLYLRLYSRVYSHVYSHVYSLVYSCVYSRVCTRVRLYLRYYSRIYILKVLTFFSRPTRKDYHCMFGTCASTRTRYSHSDLLALVNSCRVPHKRVCMHICMVVHIFYDKYYVYYNFDVNCFCISNHNFLKV